MQLVETAERLIATYYGLTGYEELRGGYQFTYPRIICKSGHGAIPLTANIADHNGWFVLAVIAMRESLLSDLSEASLMGIRGVFDAQLNAWQMTMSSEFPRFADYLAAEQGVTCPAA
jgi:hypothetical protein